MKWRVSPLHLRTLNIGGVILIKNRLIDQVWCLDQNTDSLELIETICFNTIVLDLRAENDNCVTHVIINQKWLRSSLRASENGLREVTMKIIEKDCQ